LHGFVAAEQVEESAQGLAVLAFEMGVTFEHEASVVMGDRDQLFVDREMCKPDWLMPSLWKGLTGQSGACWT
jgi:hypothetical protein